MLSVPFVAIFKMNISKKYISGTLSECQTVWIQIRTDVLSVLIWVQTVYKQMTKVAASKEIVKNADNYDMPWQ